MESHWALRAPLLPTPSSPRESVCCLEIVSHQVLKNCVSRPLLQRRKLSDTVLATSTVGPDSPQSDCRFFNLTAA